MHRTLEPPARQVRDGVCQVDRDGARLGRHIRPIPIVAQDLQADDGLAEQKRDGAEVGVAALLAIVACFPLLFRPRMIEHVPEMVLALLLISVLLDEVFLVGQLQDNREQAQERKNHVRMQRLLERFDFGHVSLQQVWVVILAQEIRGELGDVEDLNGRERLLLQRPPGPSPAVVVGLGVVAFILGLLFGGELEEVLGQGELLIHRVLVQAEVLDVEESDVVDGVGELGRKPFLAPRSVVFL